MIQLLKKQGNNSKVNQLREKNEKRWCYYYYKILCSLIPKQPFLQRAVHRPEAAELMTHYVISSHLWHTLPVILFTQAALWLRATWLWRNKDKRHVSTHSGSSLRVSIRCFSWGCLSSICLSAVSHWWQWYVSASRETDASPLHPEVALFV